MDPNDTLRRCRDAIGQESECSLSDKVAALEELACAFQDLDDWLTNKRGVLPKDWEPMTAVGK